MCVCGCVARDRSNTPQSCPLPAHGIGFGISLSHSLTHCLRLRTLKANAVFNFMLWFLTLSSHFMHKTEPLLNELVS